MNGHGRPTLMVAVPLLAVAVLGLGTLLANLPGRGVEAPLARAPSSEPPGFAEHFATGIHLLQVGLPREAAAAFEAASRLRPHIPQAHINRGFSQLAAEDFESAEKAFSTAVNLKPGEVNAYYGWAQSLEALGDLPAALGAMRTFVHLSSEDDPFRRRALAAIWEWQVELEQATRNASPIARPVTQHEQIAEEGADARPQP